MSNALSVPVNAGQRGQWTLSTTEDALVFTRTDVAEVRTFTREELPGNVQISGLLSSFTPALIASLPKPIPFRVTVAQAEQLLAWLGPPQAAQIPFEVGRRFRALLPIGIVFVVLSLPFGERDFDLFGFLQTSLLLFTGVAAFRAPGRYVFLLDAAWLGLMSLWWLLLVLLGFRSPWLLLWLPLNAYWILTEVRTFKYFGPRDAATLPSGATVDPR